MEYSEETFHTDHIEEEPQHLTIAPYTPMAASSGNGGNSIGTHQQGDAKGVPRLNLDQHTNDSPST
jgi:hypothetical protein